MRAKLVVVVIVAACGSKSDSKAPEPATSRPKVAPDKPADKATDTPKPAKTPPTKEQRAEYKKHMKAGWAAQKAEKWADAVPEFEAALKAIDGDQRALTELGWSAQNAGDFDKARKADEHAIRIAVDKNVKAAGLYNLGTVQEKTGDKDRALKSYLASLRLRPNKTVEQAVGRLGASPGSEQKFCEPPMATCDCIASDAYHTNNPKEYEPQCTNEAFAPEKTFHLWHLTGVQNWDYLLDEKNQLVTVVGGGIEKTRHSEFTGIDKAEVKTVAGHRVLWLVTTTNASTNYPGDDADEESSVITKAVTICVIGDAKAPTHCPLRDVPMAQTTEKATIPWDANGTAKSAKTETTVDVTLADDGTVNVKLAKGASDAEIAALVGPHKLW